MELNIYKEWELGVRDISTNSFNISVGELISRYEKKRILINPEYQRHYRWTNEQKSNLIESLLLGYPIPPIFMYRDTLAGNWEVIDGLQRLASIYEFVGVLDKKMYRKEFLTLLTKTNILKGLKGKTWEDFIKYGLDFVLESATLNVIVLDNRNDKSTKYEIFRRLNSSSTKLSEQEIRNATLYETAPDVFECIEKSIKNLDFKFLSNKDLLERKDMELFLEFILIKSIIDGEINPEDLQDSFSEELNKFSLTLTSEKLELNFSKYEKFINIYSECEFKYTLNSKPMGSFINAYFEIMGSLFHLNEGKIIDKIIVENILNKKYAEWQKIKGTNNPSAINRLKLSIKEAKELYAGK